MFVRGWWGETELVRRGTGSRETCQGTRGLPPLSLERLGHSRRTEKGFAERKRKTEKKRERERERDKRN